MTYRSQTLGTALHQDSVPSPKKPDSQLRLMPLNLPNREARGALYIARRNGSLSFHTQFRLPSKAISALARCTRPLSLAPRSPRALASRTLVLRSQGNQETWSARRIQTIYNPCQLEHQVRERHPSTSRVMLTMPSNFIRSSLCLT